MPECHQKKLQSEPSQSVTRQAGLVPAMKLQRKDGMIGLVNEIVDNERVENSPYMILSTHCFSQ